MPDLTDSRLRDLYAAGAAEEGHVGDEVWERLACGEASEEERARAVEHVAGCPDCAEVYATLARFEEEAREAGLEALRGRWGPSPRRTGRWMGAAAAAAVLTLAVVLPLGRGPEEPGPPATEPLREAGTLARPEPLEPVGALDEAPRSFAWGGIGEGWTYRVELLDAAGEPLWESAATGATTLPWPAGVRLEEGAEYYWRVLALPFRGGSPVSSPLASFEAPGP